MSHPTPSVSTNGAPARPTHSPTTSSPANPAGGRGPPKMSSTAKAADGARKQASSPIDGSQRKPSAQKAWTQGTNPITQRPTNTGTSNGAIGPSRAGGAPKGSTAAPKESNTPERHANDRLTFLLASCTGLSATMTLGNGEKYTGIFSGASLETAEARFTLKMAKRVLPTESEANGAGDEGDYVGVGDDHVMVFDAQDVVDLAVANVTTDKTAIKSPNGLPGGFRTDADISGNLALRERKLQRWEPGEESNVQLSLDESGVGTWDQFQTNEKLTGQKSTYDENEYTTTIDKADPRYAERVAYAEQKEREILGSKAMNPHIEEERGLAAPDDSGVDEESKYSGVRREFPSLQTGQPNKYTPPARRPPSGQATVPGAPVDPAIISSQMARPAQAPGGPAAPPTPTASGARSAVETSKPEIAVQTGSNVAGPQSTAAVDLKAAPKTTVDTKPKLASLSKPTAGPSGALRNAGAGKPENATATVEVDVFDAFKQFSANEKMRVQRQQRQQMWQDKMVKLNDLKLFSERFKLHTMVPSDLVPILAKDKGKQEEIVEKARKQVDEAKTTVPKPAAPLAGVQKQGAPPTTPRADSSVGSAAAQVDRQNLRARQNHGNFVSPGRQDRLSQGHNVPLMPQHQQQQQQQQQQQHRTPGLLSQRLAITSQQHKAGAGAPIPHIPPVPIQDVRVPPSGPSTNTNSAMQSPASSVSTRFNAKASEFRPNPAANTFTPNTNQSNSSSPRADAPRPESTPKPQPRRVSITSFLDGKKLAPVAERPPFNEQFNPIKRMRKEVEAEGKTKEYAANDGIPQAYRTPPRWDVAEENKEKTYVDMFGRSPAPPPPSAPAISNGQMPHQHQLPPYLQGGAPPAPPQHTPQHTPRHVPVQPHHGPGGHHHYDDHRMQFSSSQSSVHPSPRAMQPFLAYPQGGQPVPVYQQVPQMNMGHGGAPMQFRALPPGAQYMTQPPPGAPIHMMPNQPPGPYMGVPMNGTVHMYSPNSGHVYPHPSGPMQQPPNANGYPSPRAGAPMMSHQGSQQGHMQQPVMYLQHSGHPPAMYPQAHSGPVTPMRGPHPQPYQPQYGASPHQHHFAQQHRGTPGTTYSQPMMPTYSMPPQIPPPTGPSHGADGGEEAK